MSEEETKKPAQMELVGRGFALGCGGCGLLVVGLAIVAAIFAII